LAARLFNYLIQLESWPDSQTILLRGPFAELEAYFLINGGVIAWHI
jgi:hypothetical protein